MCLQPGLVLFDLDNTLFDFNKSQQHAFELTLNQIGISYTPSIFFEFKRVNSDLWEGLELGTISKQQIFERRFEPLTQANKSVQVDHSPKSINLLFLKNLSESHLLFENAEAVCRKVSQKLPVAAITNGDTATQKKRFKDSGLAKYFNFLVISDEVGVAKPHKEIFEFALNQHGQAIESSEVLMVGDNFTADVVGGRDAGLRTCWYNPDKLPVPTANWRPDFDIESLTQLTEVLKIT